MWIELTNRGRFTTCNDEIYLLNSAYFLLPPKEFNTSFLLSILNSSIIEFYLRQTANTSGVGTTRWINNYVKEFPIPEIPLSAQTPYIKKAELMLSLNNNLQMISNKFVKFLKSELLTDNLGNYIEKWYLLDWNEFKIELMKKKIVFSGVDKEEWYERFTRFKEEAQSIKALIDKTDNEIDQMVYELYGLTQEEIEIVENATK